MTATTAPSTTSFRIVGLPLAPFAVLFALSDAELAARGMQRVIADGKPGFPCRVSLADAEPGETLILLHYLHHDVPGPYRASGPIYVREGAVEHAPVIDQVPEYAATRLLSFRAYDASGMLLAATVAEGRELAAVVHGMFADPGVAYVHAHNAKPGCFSCRIERASA